MSKINEYPQAVTINNNDLFVIDQESGGDHATKSASVSQIADKATSGVQTQVGSLTDLTTTDKSSLVGAVNEVNGGLGNTYTKSETDTKIDSNFKRSSTAWGTSVTLPVDRNQFIVLAGTELYVVWFAATDTVRVRNVGANTTVDGTETVTIGSITFTRSGLRLTVTSTSNNAITIIG